MDSDVAHVGGERQQAHELGGHEVHVRDPVLVDGPQHPCGVEAALEHHGAAGVERQHRPGELRRVVPGPAHQGHAVGRDAEHGAEPRALHLHGVERSARLHRAHALGPSRGARRVEHHDPCGLALGSIGRSGGHHVLEGLEALGQRPGAHGHLHGEARGRRRVGGGHRAHVTQERVGHQHLGAGVRDHVGQLVGRAVEVHRDQHERRLQGGADRLEHLPAVVGEHRHGVTGSDPAVAEGVDQAVHPLVELPHVVTPSSSTRAISSRRSMALWLLSSPTPVTVAPRAAAC